MMQPGQNTMVATTGDVFRDALKSVYDPEVLSFALACGFIALAICLLDWVCNSSTSQASTRVS